MMSNSIHERFYKKIIYRVEGKDYIKFFNNITTNKIEFKSDNKMIRTLSVSYTHLTLPTSDLV